MGNHIEKLHNRYRNKGILVDTNLLLLYFLGNCDRSWIQKFKRTSMFTEEDYDLLLQFLKLFKKVVTTPNILTEVSNLSNQLPNDIKSDYYPVFAAYISKLDEHYTESRKICTLEYFQEFGLTDCGIINLVKGKYLVITADLPLAIYLEKNKIDVINFNYLRPSY